MKPAFRLDQVAGGLRPLRRDANGYLHFDARAARVGVYSYVDVDGTRELITADELFDPASMQSAIGVPVTDLHPPELLLDPTTAVRRQLGSIYGARRDGDDLIMAGVITDAALALKVETEQQTEVSPGYQRGLKKQSGTWVDGERFDAQQVQRLYNHFSIVPRGRCSTTCGGGPCKCAIRTDGATGGKMPSLKKKPAARGVRLDGQMFTVSQEVLESLLEGKTPEEQAEFWKSIAMSGDGDDAAEAEVTDAPESPASMDPPAPTPRTDGADLASLRARLDAAEARASAAEKAAERTAKAAAEASTRGISEHLAALDRARLVKGARFDGAGMTPAQMDRATLVELYPEEKAEIEKYSDLEVGAHIKQAFHETRGDARVRGARQNIRGDGFGLPAAAGKDDEWSKAVEAERRFNGQSH